MNTSGTKELAFVFKGGGWGNNPQNVFYSKYGQKKKKSMVQVPSFLPAICFRIGIQDMDIK